MSVPPETASEGSLRVVEHLGLTEALARIKQGPARPSLPDARARWWMLAWAPVVVLPIANVVLATALVGPVVGAWPSFLGDLAGWSLLLLVLAVWCAAPGVGALVWARRRVVPMSLRRLVRVAAISTVAWNVVGLALMITASPYPIGVLLSEDGAWIVDWVRLVRHESGPAPIDAASGVRDGGSPDRAVRLAMACAMRGRQAIERRSADDLTTLAPCVTRRAAALLALSVCNAVVAEGVSPRPDETAVAETTAPTPVEARRAEHRVRFALVLRRHGAPPDPARWDPELAADLAPRGRAFLADVASLAEQVFAYRDAVAALRGQRQDRRALSAQTAASLEPVVAQATLSRSGPTEMRIDAGQRAFGDVPAHALLEDDAWRIDWPRPREADMPSGE